MRDSIVFYRSFYEAICELPDEQQLSAIKAILEYGLNGSDDATGTAKALLMMAQPIIDRDIKNLETYSGRHCAEYIKWRKEVFERDSYTCQNCGAKGVKLNAHHILSYSKFPRFRYDINNGITLCEKCHRKIHRKRNCDA